MDEKMYNKISGAYNNAGADFEIKMAALLFMRGMNSTQSFALASNVNNLGYFDDLLFSYVDKNEERYTYVIQLKHKSTKSRMSRTELNSRRGVHSVMSLYPSYAVVCETLKKLKLWTENVELVLFTNDNLSTKCRNVQQTSILSTGGAVYTLDDENYPLFQHAIEYSNKEKELEHNLKLEVGRNEAAQLKDKDSAKVYFEEFANKFRLYSGQADERNLDEIIQYEITKAFGTNSSDTQITFLVLMEHIRKWWEDGYGYYLTRESSFWKYIVTFQIVRVCETNISDLQKFNLRYSDIELEKIRKQIPQNAGVKILTDSIDFTTLKVNQSISEMSFLLVDGKTFVSRFEEIQCLCKWCDKLVIKERILPSFEDQILYQKLIWVTSSDQKDDRLMRDGIQLECMVDDIKFGHFTEASQNILLESQLEFQGYKIPVHRITRDNEYLEERLNASIFSQLLSGNCTLGTPLPEDEYCYIPYTLQYEHMVQRKILLTSDAKLCFAISGISVEELINFIPSHDTSRILCFREYMMLRNRCRYIIVRSENDYNEIAQFRANVHWLHFENGAFEWKKSTGDISFVEEYLDGNIRNISPFEVYDQTVIISADTGTDKSTLLTHLAFHLKKTNPEMWVIRVSLRDYIQELNRLPDDMQSLDVVNFLLRAAGVKEEWYNLCHLYFRNMEMVYVLIDGYDEICPTYVDKFSLMLKQLHASKLKQLWVTTPPSMKKELEKDLLSLHYTLHLLSDSSVVSK